jgi:hypothetical protein
LDTDVFDSSEENLFETEMASDWELEPANEEAADNFLDWEGANAEEATENLDDSLVLMWMRSQMPKTGMIY